MSWKDWPETGLHNQISLVWASQDDVILYYDAEGWKHSDFADLTHHDGDFAQTLRVGITAIAWKGRDNWHVHPNVKQIINITYEAELYYRLVRKH